MTLSATLSAPSRRRPGRALALASAAAFSLVGGLPLLAGIACTQDAFETALAQACAGGSKTITWDASCRGAVIPIRPGTRDRRETTCDGVVVDGQDLGIVFEMTPAWWRDARCDTNADGSYAEPCDANADNVPEACPEHEAGDWFLIVRGDDSTVANLTVRNFYDGIHFDDGTHGNSIRGMTFARQADDSFTNEPGAYGNTFARNVLVDHCDKGIQVDGRNASTSSGYDVEILDNVFTNVKQPIRGPHNGRYLVRGNLIRESGGTGVFTCDGPRFDGANAVVYWKGNTIESCQRGLRVSGTVDLVVTEGSVFRNNRLRGLFVYSGSSGSPRALVQDATFAGNGGGTSSEAGYGGLAVAGTARVDAGGGSITVDGQTLRSLGGNVFQANRSSADATLDLNNASSAAVTAESNWWGDLDPADQASGTVDFAPWLGGPPTLIGGPEPPGNLERADRKPTP